MFSKFIAFALVAASAVISLGGCESELPAQSITDITNDVTSAVSYNESVEPSISLGETSVPEVKSDTVISFLACPDNIIHNSIIYDAIDCASQKSGTKSDYSSLHDAECDFSGIYEDIAPAIGKADISYLNQETLIGDGSRPVSGYPRFNSPQSVADCDIALGFDVINLAHNHMLDSGDTSLLEYSSKIFTDAGLTAIGYYPDKESLDNIKIVERKGINVAFLAYTYSTNGMRLPRDSKAVIPLFDTQLITHQVTIAKSVADAVIVSCHWGNENSFNPDSRQKEFSALMCELGVDVVLGMHPHVIQPIEYMTSESGHKTLVVYSLGNLVSGMLAGKNMLGGMLSLDIRKSAADAKTTVENVCFIPIVTHRKSSFRGYKVYYLSDYTDELAAKHGVIKEELNSNVTTLVGGGFSRANLINTLQKYIAPEFLPPEFR